MKKTFALTSDKKKPERQVEAVKHEIKKYVAREKRKNLPEGADFWDFACRFGANQESCEELALGEINKAIDGVVAGGKTTFYLEILAKPGQKKRSHEK